MKRRALAVVVGGIFNQQLIANLLLSQCWTNCENRSKFGEVIGKSGVSCFLDSRGSRPVAFCCNFYSSIHWNKYTG